MNLNRLLSGILASIARATDIETAIKLSQEFGGTKIRFPLRPPKDGKLAGAIGHERARTLCRIYGGIEVDIPRTLGDYRTLVELKKQGASRRQMARSLCTTERTVYRRLARITSGADAGRDDPQPELPFGDS